MIRDSGVIPVGISSIISDIAQVLHIDYQEANLLYLQYGKAMSSLAKGEDMFELKTSSMNCETNDLGQAQTQTQTQAQNQTQTKKISKGTLSAIIEARLEEIFMLIKQQLVNHDLYSRLGTGIVFTGGGSLLPGISQLAYRIFDFPAKISRGSFVQGIPDELKNPLYSCALGLLCYHLQSKIDGVTLSYALNPPRKEAVFTRFMKSVQNICI